MDEFKDYEEQYEKIREENNKLLKMFEKDMQNLTPKTISRHLNNVSFYLNTYLLREGIYDYTHGIWEIDSFLGGFFIRKCMWSTPGTIKSTAVSIKKFYKSMVKHGMIEKSDYECLCETIKENMWQWQIDCEDYNNPDMPNPFMFF